MNATMNRRERRAQGYTERRIRKIYEKMVDKPDELKGMNMLCDPKLSNVSFSSLATIDMQLWIQKEKERRTDRIQGKPRRWQVERARRRG